MDPNDFRYFGWRIALDESTRPWAVYAPGQKSNTRPIMRARTLDEAKGLVRSEVKESQRLERE